ncbi:MAG: hypothetical protein ACQESC_01795 [Nanobdellota archaeon]
MKSRRGEHALNVTATTAGIVLIVIGFLLFNLITDKTLEGNANSTKKLQQQLDAKTFIQTFLDTPLQSSQSTTVRDEIQTYYYYYLKQEMAKSSTEYTCAECDDKMTSSKEKIETVVKKIERLIVTKRKLHIFLVDKNSRCDADSQQELTGFDLTGGCGVNDARTCISPAILPHTIYIPVKEPHSYTGITKTIGVSFLPCEDINLYTNTQVSPW